MRLSFLILPALALGVFATMLITGADADLARWAAGWQRAFQNELAGALRALRSGDPGALALMIGLCFAYGVVHAIGPGHGKVLIGGYGVGRRVPIFRLSAIALCASLGQAVTAIAIVCIGILGIGWTRVQATGAAEGIMAPLSALAIGLVGIWLAIRGAGRLWRMSRTGSSGGQSGHDHHDHDDHRHEGGCAHEGCGHRHGPTIEEVSGATSARGIAVLIASIAIRPCSGALLLLVLTWHMGLLAAGIAGSVAMSLGTGAVTAGVAILAVTARESTLLSFGEGSRVRLFLPCLEVLAGSFIILASLQML
ncbi:hypothetical protein RM543_09965 [Roseicyclus sp. F158]|uniref:Nickel/cobalt efflux system n=1 Tax=Tropicimonas omnivorans TaxID=3075590 RepID=A0ABU3DH26_9RHOB|nr:hypothetical protein [Roseicyclus sp. F158]MDT0683013.1 hypothetical protein [Roseicyclus sp. F158]